MANLSKVLFAACCILLFQSCATLKNDVDVDALLEAAGERAYLEGEVKGLGKARVYNNRDFTYALDFAESENAVVYSHLVSQFTELSMAKLDADEPTWTVKINESEFDVESVSVIGTGESARVVAASRQGTVRLFALSDGRLLKQYIHGTSLTASAVSPDEKSIALGTSSGRLVILDSNTLAFKGMSKIHSDELRALLYTDDSTILSTSFDGSVKEVKLEGGAPDIVQLSSAALEGGYRVFLLYQNKSNALPVVRDSRQPFTIVKAQTVKRLKLKGLTEMAQVLTPAGIQERPSVEFGTLSARYFNIKNLKVAVCDECVPAGAEMVLGADVLSVMKVVDNIAGEEVWISAANAKDASSMPASAPASAPADVQGKDTSTYALTLDDEAIKIVAKRSLTLPGPGTDIDFKGGAVAVSYSHAKPLRSYAMKEAEDKGEYPPKNEGSAAAIIDMASFSLARRFVGHRGFTYNVALSPDGNTLASGGWDNKVVLFNVKSGVKIAEYEMGWNLRGLRFSNDARYLGVAAWTPTGKLGNGASDPAMMVYPVIFVAPKAAQESKN